MYVNIYIIILSYIIIVNIILYFYIFYYIYKLHNKYNNLQIYYYNNNIKIQKLLYEIDNIKRINNFISIK